MILNMIPEVIINKITLYNSTVLCDLFKSRLKIDGLMVIFKLQSGKCMRLWHYKEPIYGSKWTSDIERKIQYYNYCRGAG